MQALNPSPAPAARRPGHRLLIIDDNPAIHEDFRKILGGASPDQLSLLQSESVLFGAELPTPSDSEFEIDCASQGREGLALLQQARVEGRPYALAFVDGRMPPGWDGIETIGHLWREQRDLQVVLCTAYSDYTWQAIRQELGESDGMLILKKPFDNVEVLQLAHTLTKKWNLNREVQGRVADLDRRVREDTRESSPAPSFVEAAIAQASSGILIAEAPAGRIVWANAAALGRSGLTNSLLSASEIGRQVDRWQLFRADGSPYPLLEQPLTRAVREGETTHHEEIVIRSPEGPERRVFVNATPIRGPDGQVVAGIVIFHDFMERKHAPR